MKPISVSVWYECSNLYRYRSNSNFWEGLWKKTEHVKHEERDDDEEEIEIDEDEDENQTNVEIYNLKPSLEKLRDALEKVKIILQKVSPKLKFDLCEFETKNQIGLVMHVIARHTNKS